MNLKQICFTLWKSKFERKGIQQTFCPMFERYIGIENTTDYDDILATINSKCEEFNSLTLLFDGSIPLGDGKIVQYFSNQLNTVDFNNLKIEDVNIFPDNPEVTQVYYESLKYIINLANKNEKFVNDNIRINFIKKIIIWSYLYIKQKNIKFDDSMNPKCIYYGDITKHEGYFLILLYRMMFDVIYINPLNDKILDVIDTDHLSHQFLNKMMLPVDSFSKRIKNGKIINSIESVTLQIEQNLNDTLYGNGVYKPWQFKEGNVQSVFFNSTIIDVDTNIIEPAKVRTGFKVQNNTVYVPCFFQDIEGEYEDFTKYKNLVKKCTYGDNVLVVNDCGQSVLPKNLDRNNMLKLTFCMNSDGTMNIEKIKNVSFYPLSKYRIELQNLILNKINETLNDKHLFNFSFKKEEILAFVMMILFLDRKIIRLIDGFDFTSHIPKITVFLNNEDELSKEFMIILGYLSEIGFDIIIFNPSGMFNSGMVIQEDRINVSRLEKMKYDRTLSSLNLSSESNSDGHKKGILERLFG